MKNKKGFTLVEMLAVVAILIIVMAIITPKIFTQFKHAEKVTDQEQINSLIETARIYMNQNSNLLPEENNIYIISLNDLKESGLIQTNQILNPSTKEELTGFIIVKYENNKYKYEYKKELEQITVTFDPQGGTLQETSKNVITGEKYGTLPTPTREGYTFMGWRGKNMLKLAGRSERNPGGSFYNTSKRNFTGDGIYVGITSNNYYLNTNVKDYEIDDLNNIIKVISNGSGYGVGFDLKVTPNTQYTVSSTSPCNIRLGQYQEDGTFITWNSTTASQFKLNETFTTSNDTYWLLFTAATSAAKPIEYTNVQLEEGDTATEYEPYQEYTSFTIVTKEDNHTLYAIWKANE